MTAMMATACGSAETTSSSSAATSDATAENVSNETQSNATVDEDWSITYPLNSDETVSWYVQDSFTPHEKFADASESPFHTGLSEQLGVSIDWLFPTTGSDGGTFTTTLLADPDNSWTAPINIWKMILYGI